MTNETQSTCMENWLASYFEGIAALNSGAYKKAVYEFESAVEIARNLELADPLTDTLVLLGDALRLLGQFEEAERTLWRAIDYSFVHWDVNRVPYGFSLGALGRLYMDQDRYEKAIWSLEWASSMLRHHRASAEPEYLSVFFALIICYLQMDEDRKADKLSRYTYDLGKLLVGPNDAASVVALAMCSGCAERLGNLRRAKILHYQLLLIMQDQKASITSDELGIVSVLDALRADGFIGPIPAVAPQTRKR